MRPFATTILSQQESSLNKVWRSERTLAVHNKQSRSNTQRESAMARTGLAYLPKQNPCAQCGKPIAMPEWVESSEGRTCYLWHCWACDYQVEAIAFFDESDLEERPVAA
jgi:hypothetical protein